MKITRRIHLNPQSKGNLGKSFEAEFRTAWLDQLGVQWNGSDLDDRHHTFASRHKDAVRSYQLGNDHESKTALLSLFRRVLKDTAPVHVIDTRAQADALIMAALEELQVLDVCAEQAVRLTFFLFPTDDTESMTNAGRLFLYAGDRVDYVVVHNLWYSVAICGVSSTLRFCLTPKDLQKTTKRAAKATEFAER